MSFSQLSARSKYLLSSFQRGFLDVVKLSQTLYQHKPRPTTLHDARLILLQSIQEESNVAASSLLKADKEINLINYHGGILPYMKTKRLFLIGNQTTEDEPSTTPINDSSMATSTARATNTARVAFMITKQQRVQLMQECHFTQEEIKRLTPIQASVILQEGLSASDPNWKLQLEDQLLLLSSQEEEKNREEEEDHSFLSMEKSQLDMDIGFEQRRQQPPQQQEQEGSSDMETSNSSHALTIVDTVVSSSRIDSTNGDDSMSKITSKINQVGSKSKDVVVSLSEPPRNTYHHHHVEEGGLNHHNHQNPSLNSNGSDNQWYEVIEHIQEPSKDDDDGKIKDICVVALFKTEEEAKECVEIKQDLWNKRYDERTTRTSTTTTGTGTGNERKDTNSIVAQEEEESARFSYRTRNV